ncbi:MAG TPA: TatD family hydrolase [Candidatus Acidoferrum sp.]|nr:TatD family hydrolase [Candidatus Acidoferrum sp.]
MQTRQLLQEEVKKNIVEMADAHCHLSILSDPLIIRSAVDYGVSTIITNGVDTPSNIKTLEISDNKNVFPALGVDPEHALAIEESSFEREIEFNVNMIMQNASRVVAIGEIGLDYWIGGGPRNLTRQKHVFKRFIDLAMEMDLPMSVHSRNAMKDVLEILKEKEAKRVHLHFFEGGVEEARAAQKLGYVISVPPIESAKRKRVISFMPIEQIMAESDSPVVGQTPKSVEKSIRYIAEVKGIGFDEAASLLTENTKRFFGTRKKGGKLMRY